MTTHAQDDAFREIQLNGKQLVFLFMVATVFSVVIFLCGVFVGRGVRAERTPLQGDPVASSVAVTTPDLTAAKEPPPTPAGSDPTVAAPPPAVDELSYFNRLDSAGQAAEVLKPAVSPPAEKAEKKAPESKAASETKSAAAPAKPAAQEKQDKTARNEKPPGSPLRPPAAAATPANATSATSAATTAAPARTAEPPGAGFALQVTALRERGEADAIARRLSAKGYAAYVLTPAGGAPSVYRVRIGKFKTKREAEVIATRLKKEEQFTPWITR